MRRIKHFQSISLIAILLLALLYLGMVAIPAYAAGTTGNVTQTVAAVLPQASVPSSIYHIVYQDQSVSDIINVTIPKTTSKVDIMFAIDLSGSMTNITNSFKANSPALINQLNALGYDIDYGLITYTDYPKSYSSYSYINTYGHAGYGDYAYKLNQPITSSDSAVNAAIYSILPHNGFDYPEAITRMLYESYSDSSIAWRSGSRRFIVNISDSVPHDNNINEGLASTILTSGGDPGRDEVILNSDDLDLQKVLQVLVNNKTTLIECHGKTSYLANWNYWTGLTGGATYTVSPSTLSSTVVSAMDKALNLPVNNLHLVPSNYSSWMTIEPASYATVPLGTTQPFKVTFKVPANTEQGTYTFTLSAVDADNKNYGTTNVTLKVLEPLPTATFTYAPAGPSMTNKSVVASLVPNKPVTVTNNSGAATYTFADNGNFTFNFRDRVGNTGTAVASVYWIDKIVPTATVSYSTYALTNGDVVATITPSEPVTITNNNGSNKYTFNANGSFDFQFIDVAGNTNTATAKVDWIDKTAPTATINYDPATATNTNVTATITPSETVTITNNSGSNKYTLTANGSFTFNFKDAAGNVGSTTAKVDWIDKTPPTATISYNPAATTKEDVVATLVYSEPVTVTNNSGATTYTFTENGSFTFDFKDAAGNTGSATAKVNWILKPPTITFTYSPTVETTGSVTATLVPSRPVTISNNDLSPVYTFTENGSFTFTWFDAYGNKGSSTATVDWIKSTPATTSVSYSTSTATNIDVVATLVSSKPVTITNNNGASTYKFTSNGSFTFEYKDSIGTTGSVTATVDWIDKIPPTATIAYNPPTATNGTVVATMNPSELVTVTNNGGSQTYTFSANGSFTFNFKDGAGNVGSAIASVSWIDTSATSTTINYTPNTLTNGKVVATLVSNKPITITNNSGSNTYTFNENGSFTFQYKDSVGVDKTATANVTWIDKAAPAATITYSTTAETSGKVVATLNTGELVTVINNDLSPIYTFTDNGTFTFQYKDSAGNIGSSTATVTWIKSGPTAASVSYSSTSATNANVVATLVTSKPVTITNNNGSSNYTFTNNGSFTFQYTDSTGSTGSATATVNWIDKTPPTATISYNPATATNGTVVATITPSEPITVTNNNGSMSYTFSANGTFTFNYKDGAGNIGSTIASVVWIDNSSASASISYSPNMPTGGNVVATLTPSKPVTITNNNGSNSYTFTTNGSFTFQYKDAAGNTGSATATVTWIDKTQPTGTISYSPTTETGGAVVATLVTNKPVQVTNNDLSPTYTFTENGSFTFLFKDTAGNTGSATATVTWIKSGAPTATISYSSTTATPYNVIATLTPSKPVTITNNNGSSKYTFTANGSFKFDFVDSSGNPGSATATVNWIDKIPPTATVTYNPPTATNGTVVATMVPSEPVTVTNNNGSLSYTFTANGTFTFSFKDAAGHVGSVIATVSWIGSTATSTTITYSPSTLTSGNVVASLVSNKPITVTNNGGSNVYTFTDNGSFTFQYKDSAGVDKTATAIVTWIDKTKPTATISYSPSTETSGSVVATLVASESIQVTNNDLSPTYTFTENGSFTFQFKDSAGNIGSATATVTWIKSGAPTATISYSSTTATPYNVIATLTPSKPVTITNNNGSSKYTFTANGSFKFDFVDSSGNPGSATATVNWIDKIPPTASVTYNPPTATNGTVVATMVPSEPVTVTNNNGSLSYTFTANGTFTFSFKDAAGHVGSVIATVSWIGSTATSTTITYSPNTLTSGNVVASLVSNKPITVTNNGGSNVYTFADNGSFTFQYKDSAGADKTATATVTWIDKTKPTATISYSPSTETSGNVVATLIGSEPVQVINNDLSPTFTFTDNGSFTFQFKDQAGNIGSATATVTWIKAGTLTATINYSTKVATNGNVTASLVTSKPVTITNNYGYSNYTFSNNGSFTFQYKDSSGNPGSATATVDWIDKIPPSATITYNPPTATSGVVVATIVSKEPITVTNNGGSPSYTFTTNGKFTFNFKDAAGNTTFAIASVVWIDNIGPSANISYSTTQITNGQVVATLAPNKPVTVTNNNGASTYTFSDNGSFTFQFKDEAGNSGTATAIVNWIDKTPPTATITYSPSTTTSSNVVATMTSSEPVTVINNDLVPFYTFTANGSFTFRFIDRAGNVGTAIATVNWIQK